jgi:hypothetical protein
VTASVAGFWRYAYARQEIWQRRWVLGEPFPWTTDPVLRTRRFCNVHRELDRGTCVLFDLLHSSNVESTEQLVLNVLIYRLFNRPELATWVTGQVEAQALVYCRAKEATERRRPIFSRTWMANGGDVRVPLPDRLAGGVAAWDLGRIARVAGSVPTSFKLLYDLLYAQPLLGSVLAYQVALDLAQLVFPALSDDEYVPEPKLLRSKWGKEAYGPRALATALFPDYPFGLALAVLRERQGEQLAEVGLDWADVAWEHKPRLTLADLEHALCEYGKYLRGDGGGVFRPWGT